MKNKIIKIIIFLILLSTAKAQAVLMSPTTGGSLRFDLTPQNPPSFTQVKIKAVSFDTDLSSSNISWYLNEKLQSEGVGEDVFLFKTGAAGAPVVVKMIAKKDDNILEKSTIINPGEIQIIWQADTYVPPAYRGKAMPSPKSLLKINAIPNLKTENGTKILDKDINFEWEHNGSKISSGFGKNSIEIILGGLFSEDKVSLVVYDKTGTISAEKHITLKPEKTELVFYEENPISGTNYNRAIQDNYLITEKEFSIRAEPFFFSKPSSKTERGLLFDWQIDGKGVTPKDDAPKILTIRNETEKELTSTISLIITNTKKIFQDSSLSVKIKSNPFFNF